MALLAYSHASTATSHSRMDTLDKLKNGSTSQALVYFSDVLPFLSNASIALFASLMACEGRRKVLKNMNNCFKCINGFQSCDAHVGAQNNSKIRIMFCVIIESNSQKTFFSFVLCTNMVTMISAENHQFQLRLGLFLGENTDTLNKNKHTTFFISSAILNFHTLLQMLNYQKAK